LNGEPGLRRAVGAAAAGVALVGASLLLPLGFWGSLIAGASFGVLLVIWLAREGYIADAASGVVAAGLTLAGLGLVGLASFVLGAAAGPDLAERTCLTVIGVLMVVAGLALQAETESAGDGAAAGRVDEEGRVPLLVSGGALVGCTATIYFPTGALLMLPVAVPLIAWLIVEHRDADIGVFLLSLGATVVVLMAGLILLEQMKSFGSGSSLQLAWLAGGTLCCFMGGYLSRHWLTLPQTGTADGAPAHGEAGPAAPPARTPPS